MSFKSNIRLMQYGMPDGDERPTPKPRSGIATHLKNAASAHTSGDHATAKKHALKAVNALHRMAQPSAPPPDTAPSAAPC